MTHPSDDDRTHVEITGFRDPDGGAAERDAEALARIGGYRLIELLGQGGMGSVWLAEQLEPVRRKVALKLIHGSALDGLGRALFEVERQMLAQMAHPCIAQVFDAGSTDDGRPWFAMEWVPGQPVTDHAEAQGLDTAARLRLFIRICQGVQHAHERGIIHRDLKPANVLVCTVDGEPLPKIIDFGVATSVSDQGGQHRANSSDRAGTRAYMSPEQYTDDVRRIDTRSDVYALGVMLFELLTGARPPSTADRDALDTFHTALGRGAASRIDGAATPVEALTAARGLDRELRCILARALAPAREQRYPSAAELARDLERQLAGDVVEAVPPTRRYRWSKFVRRNRLALGVGSLVLAALVGGLALALWGLVQAQAERDRAQLAAARAEQTADFVVRMLDSIDPAYASGADTALMRRVLDDAALRAENELADQPDILAEIALTIGSAYLAIGADTEATEHIERAERLAADRGDLERLALRAARQRIALAVRLGEGEQALSRARALVEHTDALGPADELLRLEARSMLAHALQHVGDPDAAESVIVDVIETAAGADDPAIVDLRLEAMRTLAQLHSDRMQLERAHAVYAQMLDELAGRDDPAARIQRLWTLNDHAVVFLREQRYAEAEPLLRETLASQRELFGDEHPMTLAAVSNLAGSLRQQGRPDEALPFYRETLDGFLDLYGERHSRSLIARHNLGNCLLDLGRPDESAALHREALVLGREELPDNDFVLGMFELGLGKSELARGNPAAAVPLLESAEARIAAAAGADHYRADEARDRLAQARAAIEHDRG
ncbi:serine/threonine protein kinase [Wenzhouxiangella sp. XN79A]|uniref:serine/threonine-protein kinase n=1 Tax=Wenzhouxiangella sp. XN79A TaxID=2724193 RepID=UPI00144AAB80|nr:serine/threonine-protein kinase [Wenzhouxiangella sp. XN79A]NKI35636.1 serine/threonine protein kinase [Wenzhouxiangella sp. XN79A]